MIKSKTNKDLLLLINSSITLSNISELNLETGKEYLITYDIENNKLSLKQDIDEVIYIRNIQFSSPEKVKEELLRNTVFERLMGDEPNINLEFFDEFQYGEITRGLDKGLDVRIFAKPCFIYPKMSVISEAMDNKIDTTLIANSEYSTAQLTIIYCGLTSNLDITKITNPKFDAEQMSEILNGIINDIDVSIYAKEEFNSNQMSVIRGALEDGIDVSSFAKSEIRANNMQLIVHHKKWNLDINYLLDPNYEVTRADLMNFGLTTEYLN